MQIPHWLITLLAGIPITGVLGYLWQRNNAYSKIIEEFKEKLRRPQNKAQVLTPEEVVAHPLLPDGFQHITVVNVATHKTSITDSDLDSFYNKLVNFDYTFVLFKKYYQKHTKNLVRLKPKAESKDFELVVLQGVLERDENLHPLRFLSILKYHLKWEIKPFSTINVFFVRRKAMKRAKKQRMQTQS